MSRSGKSNRLLTAAVLTGIFALMLLLNIHTPLMMDDYDYSFSWNTGERLAGIGDIFASQRVHYSLWGGRSVTHFLAQLFLYLGKPVFNVANAAMYCLLLIEIGLLAGKKEHRLNWRLLLAAHSLLFFLIPFFGVAFLWLDGACNYLWGTALALVPMVIARSERENGFFDAGFERGWLALPLCFLAGWTNENTACGVLAALLLMMVWDGIKGRRIRRWRVAALAAQAVGVMLLLLAPGNFARAAEASGRGFVMEMIYRFAVTSYCLLRYCGVILLLGLAALLLAKKRRVQLRTEWLCMLLGAALLSTYALVGSPQISDRSYTAVIVLLAAALLTVTKDIGLRTGKLPAAIVLVLCVTGGALALSSVTAHESAWNIQLAKIEAVQTAGETEVMISSVPSVSRYTMSIMLERNPDSWPNSTMGKYFSMRIHGE